jgi:hypothetical protein
MSKSVSEILDAAADLIEPEGAWTQGTWARKASGSLTSAHFEDAVCFCARGAIVRAGNFPLTAELPRLNDLAGFRNAAEMARWNDAPERTQAEVVAKLREAAMARERGE